MTRKGLTDITVHEAHDLVARNGILVDVREPHEQAAERIDGAVELPLSRLANGASVDVPADRVAIFLCASGTRTKINSTALAGLAGGEAYNMTGGIIAWKRAGFPTTRG
jgi:rhodanese-related sulfurtransferase